MIVLRSLLFVLLGFLALSCYAQRNPRKEVDCRGPKVEDYARNRHLTPDEGFYEAKGVIFLRPEVCLFCPLYSKRPFAEVCRGTWAKRKMMKLEPLFEQPRTQKTPGYSSNDNQFSNYESLNENDIYDKGLLETLLLQKIAARRSNDYDTGSDF